MALGQSTMSHHFNYRRAGSQTVTLETVKEAAPAPPRALPLRGATFSTAPSPWKVPAKRSNNGPNRRSPLWALIQGRKSGALLVMMFGALVAPTFIYMVTHATSKEAPPPNTNLRGPKSDGGLAPLTPPLPPPRPPPSTTTRKVETQPPRTIPPKPKTTEGEKKKLDDPVTPPKAATPKPKPTEVYNEPKKPKPEDDSRVEEEKPLECIESPLWNAEVDTSKYEYGCKEIEVSFEISLRFFFTLLVQ